MSCLMFLDTFVFDELYAVLLPAKSLDLLDDDSLHDYNRSELCLPPSGRLESESSIPYVSVSFSFAEDGVLGSLCFCDHLDGHDLRRRVRSRFTIDQWIGLPHYSPLLFQQQLGAVHHALGPYWRKLSQATSRAVQQAGTARADRDPAASTGDGETGKRSRRI